MSIRYILLMLSKDFPIALIYHDMSKIEQRISPNKAITKEKFFCIQYTLLVLYLSCKINLQIVFL